jgi:uncharacterized membrane protein
MKNDKLNKYLWFSGLVLLIMLGVSLFAWVKLPASASIPVHWGLNGQPDRYGSKFEALLIMPIIATLLILLQWAIPKLSPQKANLEDSAKAYNMLWLALSVFLLGMHILTALVSLNVVMDLVTGLTVMMGIMFMIIGNYMGKMRTNYFVGIRTPWTLESKQSWNKTHRLGGKVFVAVGLLTVVSGILLEPTWTFIVMMGGLLGGSLGLVYYSYYVWKQEKVVVSQ